MECVYPTGLIGLNVLFPPLQVKFMHPSSCFFLHYIATAIVNTAVQPLCTQVYSKCLCLYGDVYTTTTLFALNTAVQPLCTLVCT